MHIRQNGNALFDAAMLLVGITFGAWLLAATPAQALGDKQQLLTGGNRTKAGVVHFVSPGTAVAWTPDTPGPGKGESAAQLRMQAGVLSGLKVKLTTQAAPTSGLFFLSVRKNGVETILACFLAASGNCNAAGTVAIANNDLLSVRVANNFVGSGSIAYTYTLLFD